MTNVSIIPNTTADEARALTERIRSAAEARRLTEEARRRHRSDPRRVSA
jgi:hypothetical protein